jgi:hypothetical protein
MSGEGRLHASAEVEAAHWIAARLDSYRAWTVGSIVPTGFEAYVRVFHPVEGLSDELTRWSEVAALSGRAMHPLAEFGLLARPAGEAGGGEPDGAEPSTGELLPALLLGLAEVLRGHTRAPDACRFCIWEGGWVEGPGSINVAVGATQEQRVEAQRQWEDPWERSFPGDVLAQPRVCLPGRNYVLLEGPLDAVGEIGVRIHWRGEQHFEPHSPNLWWPDDRAWCVATDIDLDSTYVGGSAALVRDLLQDERFEALQVNASDIRRDIVNREA